MKQYLPDRAKGRLLEIGCGDGFLLSLLVREGWKAEGLDFDSAAVAVARARGLEVREGTLEKQAFDSDCFDAIVMVHVIEHVPDPARLIQECARILKPGGVIVVITPNIASLGHHWFGKSWLHLDPPRHLHIFSPRALHDMGMAAGLMAVTCSTTAYHAHVSLQGSMGIKRNGRFSLGAPRTILDILLTRGLQFIQWIAIASRIRPDAGDELVMVAKRNQAF